MELLRHQVGDTRYCNNIQLYYSHGSLRVYDGTDTIFTILAILIYCFLFVCVIYIYYIIIYYIL